jgi:hypothetical protein
MVETLMGTTADGQQVRFRLEVASEGDHWVSTLARLNEDGIPESDQVAPRFYGVTAEQARRRMVTVLEGQYEEVRVK